MAYIWYFHTEYKHIVIITYHMIVCRIIEIFFFHCKYIFADLVKKFISTHKYTRNVITDIFLTLH